MKNEKINMDARILQYNLHYGFMENPVMFNFEYNPHRLIVRNYALRNNHIEVYKGYLLNFFPDRATKELEQFGVDILHLKYFNKDEASKWLMTQEVKVLQFDINADDQDAVFNIVYLSDQDDINPYLNEENDDFILRHSCPNQVLKSREKIWLDTRVDGIGLQFL